MRAAPAIRIRPSRRVGVHDRLLRVAPATLIASWALDEVAGTVAFDASGNGRNGASSNVTLGAAGIGDGRAAATFNGTTSYCNVYSAGLAAAFAAGELTIAAWLRVSAAGVWTDGSNDCAVHLGADGSANFVRLLKGSTNNQFQWNYMAGGTTKSVTKASFSPVTWFHAALTVSKTADQMKAYVGGTQEGATQTGLGVWAGALAATLCVIGAQTTTPALPWNGLIAHVALWSVALSAAQIALLAAAP